MKLLKAGNPNHLGRASSVLGHLDSVPVVKVDNRTVIKLVCGNSPDGTYVEFDDGCRVSLTDIEWKLELSRLLEK